MLMVPQSEFYSRLKGAVDSCDGLFNAHLHLDRAGTLAKRYLAHMSMDPIEASGYSLRVKQNLTGDLHRGPAYQADDLKRRIQEQLELMVKLGTRRADSFIDVSADNVMLTALDVALELKREFKDKIDFRVGAYPIFGFREDMPERWELFAEAVERADYIGVLPERDDTKVHPNHIGFEKCFYRTLQLAIEQGKPIHYHVDQANDPREIGTKKLIQVVSFCGSPEVDGVDDEPTVWAVHAISPTAYKEERFGKILDGLLEQNIGIVSCPSAALSMRQLRPLKAPTHNSIARVLEMVEAGVPIRFGSDNIADVFLPATTASLYDEMMVFANAVRFYNPDILGKMMCGCNLTDMDCEIVGRALEQDKKVFARVESELVAERNGRF